MNSNFSTIDGLFRPNYNVYKYSTDVTETDPEILEPILVTYKPKDIHRIKSIITEVPQETLAPEQTEDISDTQDETTELPKTNQYKIELEYSKAYSQPGYKRFKEELAKFIEENPQYADIQDSLSRIAALESAYVMDIPNKAGSSALGWFQFTDGTRKAYNSQTREQFTHDPQAQLMAAARHYTNLQREVKKRGGDPNDFVTMYGAWWRPASAYNYIKNPDYDFKTKYNESFQQIIQRARNLLNRNEKSIG